MNKDIFVGLFKEFKGKVTHAVGIFNEDRIKRAAGKLKIFEGFLQSRFGFIRWKAKKKAKEIVKDLNSSEKTTEKI